MIDIKYIKENPDEVVARLAAKGKDAKEDVENILRLDGERRTLIAETAIISIKNKFVPLCPVQRGIFAADYRLQFEKLYAIIKYGLL